MAASYPASLFTKVAHTNIVDIVDASHVNTLEDEIVALETYIGTNPHVSAALSQTFTSVDDRLENIESSFSINTHTHSHDALTGLTTGDPHTQYLLESAYTAKGVILVGTGAGTFLAVGVGSNGQVLLADSTQSSGVRWGAITVGGSPTASAPGDTTNNGASTTPAAADHRHAREAWGGSGDVGAMVLGQSSTAGATGKTADAGHKHSFPAAAAPTTSATGDTSATGSSGNPADAAHKHARVDEHLAVMAINGAQSVRTGVSRFRFPFPATLKAVSVAVNTAPTGASLIYDINKNGTTIYTTQGNRPTVAASANASSNAGGGSNGEAVPDVTAMAAGDYLTVDTDQIGSTVAGADATIFVRYSRP